MTGTLILPKMGKPVVIRLVRDFYFARWNPIGDTLQTTLGQESINQLTWNSLSAAFLTSGSYPGGLGCRTSLGKTLLLTGLDITMSSSPLSSISQHVYVTVYEYFLLSDRTQFGSSRSIVWPWRLNVSWYKQLNILNIFRGTYPFYELVQINVILTCYVIRSY